MSRHGTVRHVQSLVSIITIIATLLIPGVLDGVRNVLLLYITVTLNSNFQILQIKPGCSIGEFLSQAKLTPPTEATPSSLKSPEEEESRRHILVGLHTCGDLGATMMRVFRESEDIAGLVSLGCCYMKLSSQEDTSDSVDHPSPSSSADSASLGYPLSDFVLSLLPSSSLSYEAREVACHSIDSYSRQLQQGTN